MRWWNTETRNEQGAYYRIGDWSVDRPDDWRPPHRNFTATPPPEECMRSEDPVPCDWDGAKWNVDNDKKVEIEHKRDMANTEKTDILLAVKVLTDVAIEGRALGAKEYDVLRELSDRMQERLP